MSGAGIVGIVLMYYLINFIVNLTIYFGFVPVFFLTAIIGFVNDNT